MGCEKTRTTAYHPAGSGGIERNNRFIITVLKNYVQQDPKSRKSLFQQSAPRITQDAIEKQEFFHIFC